MKKIEVVEELSKVCDAESNEEPDEVLDDDDSDERVDRRALRRATLRVGVITSRNPNVLFLVVVRDVAAISVDGVGGIRVTRIFVDGIVVYGNSSASSDLGSDSESSKHKKGETVGNFGVVGRSGTIGISVGIVSKRVTHETKDPTLSSEASEEIDAYGE
ncbi:hypothetical protein Tco_0500923 [Tanacetum coccineum]